MDNPVEQLATNIIAAACTAMFSLALAMHSTFGTFVDIFTKFNQSQPCLSELPNYIARTEV